MRRRAFLTGVALLLGSPVPSRGQSAKKIGWLNPASHETAASSLAVFREELKELGHIEGRHYTLEQRDAGGGTERLPGLAGELAALPVDMIVAPGTSTALAAMQATRVIPIVIVTVADPVGSGLVRSFARPEGNVTGTALALDEISRKWLELLPRAARPPDARRRRQELDESKHAHHAGASGDIGTGARHDAERSRRHTNRRGARSVHGRGRTACRGDRGPS